MDISLLFSHLQPGAITKLWISPKWIEISMCFFHRMKIWDIGDQLALVLSLYVASSLNGVILEKMVWLKISATERDLENHQKLPNFAGSLWPSHLTKIWSWGTNGKRISISFIWYLVMQNTVSPCSIVFALWNGTANISPRNGLSNKSLGNFEKYHIAAKFYPPFLLAKTCSLGNKISLSQ